MPPTMTAPPAPTVEEGPLEDAAPAAAPTVGEGPPPPEDHALPGSDTPRPGTDLAVRRSDAPAALPDMMNLARELALADVLPAHLRRKPANVLAVMFASRALDIPMWTAFQVLHIVEGKVAMDATFQRAMVIRAGHQFRITVRTDERAVAVITRFDDPANPQSSEFTWAEAQTAGLATKNTWQKYRRAMLVARVTTQIIRDVCPEVLFSPGYAPEELDMVTDEGGNPVTVIASERLGADVRERSAQEREELRAAYERRIQDADTTAELNLIWADAKTDNVLDAPLRPGTSVKAAMSERAQVIKALADEQAAETTLKSGGWSPADDTAEPPAPAAKRDVVDAEVVSVEVHAEPADPWAGQEQIPLP